jgi:polysaccharide deacetylase family protein (PEP-CTERM system associated)
MRWHFSCAWNGAASHSREFPLSISAIKPLSRSRQSTIHGCSSPSLARRPFHRPAAWSRKVTIPTIGREQEDERAGTDLLGREHPPDAVGTLPAWNSPPAICPSVQVSRAVTNYLTVDLEEWFHIDEDLVPETLWPSLTSRVEENVEDLLRLLERHRVRATFFVLGWVAERHPALICRVLDEGHGIASHGYGHRLVHRLTPAEFEKDLLRSGEILKAITGRRPKGYRAPRWSLGRGALWAIPLLIRHGFTYDSSLAPCPFIGSPDFPREPHVIGSHGLSLREYPLLAGNLGVRGMLLGGGWGIRLLSLDRIFHEVDALNARGVPALINVHPWELDPSPPRLPLSLLVRFVHYAGLRGFPERLSEIFRKSSFGPIPE